MRIAVFRKAHFNAAHKLYRQDWSAEKNKEVFGLCSNHNYHGHNYELEVKVVGEVDPETGFLIDLKDLKDIIKTEVEDRFDHKNFNLDTPYFKDKNPTSEYIAVLIHELLTAAMDPKFEITVRLWETPRNYVEYPA